MTIERNGFISLVSVYMLTGLVLFTTGRKLHNKDKLHYFPIQKFRKIFPSNSSVVISPVISPR